MYYYTFPTNVLSGTFDGVTVHSKGPSIRIYAFANEQNIHKERGGSIQDRTRTK